MWWRRIALLILAPLVVMACEVATPPAPTTVPPPLRTPTPAPTPRPLGVAVPVGSPTPTPALVGDYASIMRPRLQSIQPEFSRLEQQLAAAQKTPLLMAQD